MEVGVGQGVAEQITQQYPVYNNAEVTFSRKLEKEQGKSPDLLTSWFSSHPPTDARIREYDRIKGELPALSGKLNQKEYQKAVASILAHPSATK